MKSSNQSMHLILTTLIHTGIKVPLCKNDKEIRCSQMDWRWNKSSPDSGCLKNCEGIYVNSYTKSEIRQTTKDNLKFQNFIQEYEEHKGNFEGSQVKCSI